MTEQELSKWVAASLRYLREACGDTLPWADASSDETSKETGQWDTAK